MNKNDEYGFSALIPAARNAECVEFLLKRRG